MVLSYSILFDQQIKKNSVAKSISIYDNQGKLLTMQSRNEEEIKSTQLEGGFLVAITAFAEKKIKSTCVKFESEQNGTFLILKTKNFIGSFLWNHDLNLSIDVSEEVLEELLDHLESINASKYPEKIPFIVEQYCTI